MEVRPQTMATLLKPSCGSGSLRDQVEPPTVAASGYMTPPHVSQRRDTARAFLRWSGSVIAGGWLGKSEIHTAGRQEGQAQLRQAKTTAHRRNFFWEKSSALSLSMDSSVPPRSPRMIALRALITGTNYTLWLHLH